MLRWYARYVRPVAGLLFAGLLVGEVFVLGAGTFRLNTWVMLGSGSVSLILLGVVCAFHTPRLRLHTMVFFVTGIALGYVLQEFPVWSAGWVLGWVGFAVCIEGAAASVMLQLEGRVAQTKDRL